MFFFIYRALKMPRYIKPKSRYNRARKRLFFPLNNTYKKTDRELCLVKTGTSLYPSSL